MVRRICTFAGSEGGNLGPPRYWVDVAENFLAAGQREERDDGGEQGKGLNGRFHGHRII